MSRPALRYCLCCGEQRNLDTQFRAGIDVCMLCEMLPAVEVSRLTRNTCARETVATAHATDTVRAARAQTRMAAYDAQGGKRCSSCHSIKPVAEYDRCAPRADGLQPSCRACLKLYNEIRVLPGGKKTWLTVRAGLRAQSAADVKNKV